MAYHLDKPGPPKRRQKQSKRGDPGKRPQGISKAKVQRPLRRSARLHPAIGERTERQVSQAAKTLRRTDRSTAPQLRGRKRSRETENLPADIAIIPSAKRPRPSADSAALRPATRGTQISSPEAPVDCIGYWLRKQTWPREYFEPDTMTHLLARRKSTPSLQRKRSDSGSLAASSTTPSDQKPRDTKSAPYNDPRYKLLLQTKGRFMDESDLGITEHSKKMYLTLLQAEQSIPTDSLFRDDIFKRTCRNIQDKDETRVIRDISLLIVPSAEVLATYGARELNILIESTNEGWNNSIPLTGTRPQPDYSVGFKREAFTDEQREKLAPFIGDFIASDQSFFMATYYMYFPFLTCEVKCGAAALDIADRQNAHSMTLAVRAFVELFRLVKREDEIN